MTWCVIQPPHQAVVGAGKLISMPVFVTAEWSNLVLLTYAVPDDVLAPYVDGLEIDRWEGKAYVSVVGFRFARTRVLGLNPGLVFPPVADFPQWNLRTYVRRGAEKGIVFIKEFVPHPLVAGAVRRLYNENYHAVPLSTRVEISDGIRRVRYDLRLGGRKHAMSLTSRGEAEQIASDSADHFFAERCWGSAAGHRETRFRVAHPPWLAFPVANYVVSIDFGVLYGNAWRFLNDRSPDFVTWCDGSRVDVSWRMSTRL